MPLGAAIGLGIDAPDTGAAGLDQLGSLRLALAGHLGRHRQQDVAGKDVGHVGQGAAVIGPAQRKDLQRRGGEVAHPHVAVDHQQRNLGRGKEVLQVAVGGRQIVDLGLQLVVDGTQLLVRGLKLLVHRHHFFVRALQLLVRGLKLLDGAVQLDPRQAQLLLQQVRPGFGDAQLIRLVQRVGQGLCARVVKYQQDASVGQGLCEQGHWLRPQVGPRQQVAQDRRAARSGHLVQRGGHRLLEARMHDLRCQDRLSGGRIDG